MGALTTVTADLLQDGRKPLKEDIAPARTALRHGSDKTPPRSRASWRRPRPRWTAITRLTSYGSWLNLYLCEAKVSGVTTDGRQRAAHRHRDRCSPRCHGDDPTQRPLPGERNPVAVGLVGLLVLALVGLAAYRADALPFIGGGTTYTADFTESAGLDDGRRGTDRRREGRRGHRRRRSTAPR